MSLSLCPHRTPHHPQFTLASSLVFCLVLFAFAFTCDSYVFRSFSFVLTLFIFKTPNYVLARTLTERVV